VTTALAYGTTELIAHNVDKLSKVGHKEILNANIFLGFFWTSGSTITISKYSLKNSPVGDHGGFFKQKSSIDITLEKESDQMS